MKIGDVLAAKGSAIRTVSPTVKLEEVVGIFDNDSISSVLVTSVAGRALGIVTDQIVIQKIAAYGNFALSLESGDIMNSPTPTCDSEETVSSAMETMTERRIRHLLVQEQGRMIGIVSIGDLVKRHILDVELENNVLRDMAGARHGPSKWKTTSNVKSWK